MTAFDKFSSANKSAQTVVNGMNPVLAKSDAAPALRTNKIDPENLSIKASILRQKTQKQDQDQDQNQDHSRRGP
jgi:hypothetical protein